MEKKQVDELVTKYNEGVADPSEVKLLERLVEEGEVALIQLRDLHSLDQQILKAEIGLPSMRLDDNFYEVLASEKKKQKKTSFSLPPWEFLFPRLAVAAMLILSGFGVGYFFQSPSQKTEVSELTQQVVELKEMMMLTLLEKESATQRLHAVSLTSEMDQVSEKVTDALFATLNKDESVNVRLAVLEVLKSYSKSSQVRTRLIESIAFQDSPLVQVALAELMVSIQEKKSVNALRKLLQNEQTPREVRTKISESINVLI